MAEAEEDPAPNIAYLNEKIDEIVGSKTMRYPDEALQRYLFYLSELENFKSHIENNMDIMNG